MRTNTTAARAKINVQIPLETREKLSEVAALEGKKVSVLVCESIDEKIAQIRRRAFEEKMKAAYQGLPKESIINLSQIRTIDKKRLLEPKVATL